MDKKATIKVSEIPGHRSQLLIKSRNENVPRGIASAIPVFVAETSGALVKDVDGNTFIDFTAGIGVLNFGHNHPEVVKAVREQAGKYLHTCFMVAMYEPYVEVARKLNEMTPGDMPRKTALFNSGAEAVENAVKLARRHTGKPGIVALEYAFHGRTLMTMSLTSKVKPYKYGFGPFAPGIYRMPSPYCYRCRFNLKHPQCGLECASYLEHLFNTECSPDTVAAVIAEPLQGEGGFILPPPGYFKVLAEICREHDILLVMDEVQTGFYRTGYRFASEYHQVVPDLITMAKSLAGGMPLSAVTGKAEIMDAAGPGEIGGTYGGNPVACAAALAVMELMEKEEAGKAARRTGSFTHKRLLRMQERYRIIGEVRGLGAMQAIELVKDRKTREPATDTTRKIISRCNAKGLIILSAGIFGNVIRLLMPLNIGEEELARGLDILEEALREEAEEGGI